MSFLQESPSVRVVLLVFLTVRPVVGLGHEVAQSLVSEQNVTFAFSTRSGQTFQ